MYSVERKEGRIRIIDWNGQTVYSVDENSYVVHRPGSTNEIQATQAKALTDQQLLVALAKAEKIGL